MPFLPGSTMKFILSTIVAALALFAACSIAERTSGPNEVEPASFALLEPGVTYPNAVVLLGSEGVLESSQSWSDDVQVHTYSWHTEAGELLTGVFQNNALISTEPPLPNFE